MSCPGPLADDGLNPFSFKEFLRWKALDPDPDPDHGPHEEREPEQPHGQVRSSGSGRLAGLPHSFFDAGGVACAAGSLLLSELCQQQVDAASWTSPPQSDSKPSLWSGGRGDSLGAELAARRGQHRLHLHRGGRGGGAQVMEAAGEVLEKTFCSNV